MRRALAIVAASLVCQIAGAKTLAEAAEASVSQLPTGCIVTAEQTATGTRFALAGRSPDATQAPETLVFEIASLTKLFTGLLLAEAVVEKKVTLDTTVAELVGRDFRFADERVGRITLRQLSTHTSGLPRMPNNFANGFQGYAQYDEAQMLAWLAQVKLPKDGPHACSYSNIGVALLGHLVAKQYQQTWTECVLAKVCRPLGLSHTQPSHLPSLGTLAPPYSGDKPGSVTTFQAFAPAGSLRSTAADMLKFGQALAHPERTPLKEAITLALQPHADANAAGGKVGLGAFLSGPPERRTYAHDGATAGYRSAIQVTPSQDTVRVVLMNNNTIEGSAVLKAMK
jgi:D-alanyl-D-alanine-carboxypeptidase/D-alanyl-D-alanine-endopeptidase